MNPREPYQFSNLLHLHSRIHDEPAAQFERALEHDQIVLAHKEIFPSSKIVRLHVLLPSRSLLRPFYPTLQTISHTTGWSLEVTSTEIAADSIGLFDTITSCTRIAPRDFLDIRESAGETTVTVVAGAVACDKDRGAVARFGTLIEKESTPELALGRILIRAKEAELPKDETRIQNGLARKLAAFKKGLPRFIFGLNLEFRSGVPTVVVGAPASCGEAVSAVALALRSEVSPSLDVTWELDAFGVHTTISRLLPRGTRWSAKITPQSILLSLHEILAAQTLVENIESSTGLKTSLAPRDSLPPSIVDTTTLFDSSFLKSSRIHGARALSLELRSTLISRGIDVRVGVSNSSVTMRIPPSLSPSQLESVRMLVREHTVLPVTMRTRSLESQACALAQHLAPSHINVRSVSTQRRRTTFVRFDSAHIPNPQALKAWQEALERKLNIGVLLEDVSRRNQQPTRLRRVADKDGLISSMTQVRAAYPHIINRSRWIDVDHLPRTEGRVDFRHHTGVFTQDESDVPDLDQAYCRLLYGERDVIAIHVPDMTEWANPESETYAHARSRGLSLYGLSHMESLFPPEVSCGRASLLPGRERETFSILIAPRSDGSIDWFDIVPSIVRSSARLNTAEFRSVFESSEHPLGKDVRVLSDLIHRVRHRRLTRGQVWLDESERYQSRFVEELSLLANRLFPRHKELQGVPIIRRVHSEPTSKSLRHTLEFIQSKGIQAGKEDYKDPRKWRKVLSEVLEECGRDAYLKVLGESCGKPLFSLRGAHRSLGFSQYAQVSAPTRRMTDAINWYQFSQRRSGGTPLSQQKISVIIDQMNRQETNYLQRAREFVSVERIVAVVERIGEIVHGVVDEVSRSGITLQIPELGTFATATLTLSPERAPPTRGALLPVRIVAFDAKAHCVRVEALQ